MTSALHSITTELIRGGQKSGKSRRAELAARDWLAQHGFVKGLGAVEVVGADHNMTEHDVFLILLFRQAFKSSMPV